MHKALQDPYTYRTGYWTELDSWIEPTKHTLGTSVSRVFSVKVLMLQNYTDKFFPLSILLHLSTGLIEKNSGHVLIPIGQGNFRLARYHWVLWKVVAKILVGWSSSDLSSHTSWTLWADLGFNLGDLGFVFGEVGLLGSLEPSLVFLTMIQRLLNTWYASNPPGFL